MISHPTIWTLGHSNHSFDDFAGLLASEQIEFVADVRSFPYSRFAAHFNRDELEAGLHARAVRYLFLGEALGGRPARDDHYDADGHALYAAMSQEPAFVAAVDRLVLGAAGYRIALVCSECDPQHCHRRLLVGKVLTDRGVELRHILPSGSVRSEKSVVLGGDEQWALFGEDDHPWRSTQSVSHKRRLSTSSVD